MSIIIKSTNGKEVELDRNLSTSVRVFGIDEEMELTSLLSILSLAKVNAAAHGNDEDYRAYIEIIDELNTWESEMVTVEF